MLLALQGQSLESSSEVTTIYQCTFCPCAPLLLFLLFQHILKTDDLLSPKSQSELCKYLELSVKGGGKKLLPSTFLLLSLFAFFFHKFIGMISFLLKFFKTEGNGKLAVTDQQNQPV